MSSNSNNTKQQSKGTPSPPKLENFSDTPSVLRVTVPGEKNPAESATFEEILTTSSSMGPSEKKMFPKLEEELDWNIDTLPTELVKSFQRDVKTNGNNQEMMLNKDNGGTMWSERIKQELKYLSDWKFFRILEKGSTHP